MGGSQKSKRVTWASDEYLCQVRLFLSEECPSQVGLGAQDHLQAKASWASYPSGIMSDDNLPPGFEGTQPANPFRSKLSQIPVIKWRCPPKFVVNAAWRVVAGEESKEVEIQNQREMRVLEAIYPRPSAIPTNPSTISGAEDPVHQDQQTPLIPITPIEDEDAAAAADVSDSATVTTVPMNSQPQLLATGASSSRNTAPNSPAHAMPATEAIAGVGPDVIAALSRFLSNSNQGNLIDGSLLIKLLNDPKMVEELVKNHATFSSAQTIPSTSMQNLPVTTMQTMIPPTAQNARVTSMQKRPRPMSPAMSLSETAPITVSRIDQHLPHVSRSELVAPPIAAAATDGVFPSRVSSVPSIRPMVPDVISAPSQSVGAPVKDINYYKSLIQQHGGNRQETVPQFGNRCNHQLGSISEPSNNPKPRDLKTKIMKPCIYFNSSRGCRNGANCAYQHDTSSQQRVSSMPESQGAKRMKMDREITGT